MALALLIVVALYLGWTIRRGNLWRPRIAALVGKRSTGRIYIGWALALWLGYGIPALILLALLGRGWAIVPPEFASLARTPDPLLPPMLVGAMFVGTLLSHIVARRRLRRGLRPPELGRFPLAKPARPGEVPPAALLALSAGITEELFFRLALPLLIARAVGEPLAGFAISAACFALLHRHHGPVGMLSSAVGAAILSAIYLLSGALWLAMALHVAVDLNALVVRPAAAWKPRAAD